MYYAQKRGLKSKFRSFSRALASKISAAIPYVSLMKLSGQKSILPFYHAVSNDDLTHVKHLYKVKNAKLFEKDLDFLLKHYQPIDLAELMKIHSEGECKSTKKFMHLSFDDGLSSCFHIVAPILLKKGVPATFFLNSAFIDNKALMFRYKISLCIEALNKLNDRDRNILLEKSKVLFRKKEIFKASYCESAKIDEFAFLLGLDFDNYLEKERPYMSSSEIKELIDKGFSFGSHSIDHPLYQDISFEEQLKQTVLSQKFIKDKFDINYKVFAFPFTDYGVNNAFFSRIFEEENFDLSFGGAGLKKDSVKKHLQRFPMETQKAETARQLLSTEQFYYLLKMPFGKNRIRDRR